MFIDNGYEGGPALQRSAMLRESGVRLAPLEREVRGMVEVYKHFVPQGRGTVKFPSVVGERFALLD